MPIITADQAGGKNVCAFLDTIAVSELGPLLQLSDNGYNVIVGSSPKNIVLLSDYADHPRKRVFLDRYKIYSTAAGRYQLLARYYDFYKVKLKLKDFSPLSQDLIAIQQMREVGALTKVVKGDFVGAVKSARRIWASFPGSGYGQHENSFGALEIAYARAGGNFS